MHSLLCFISARIPVDVIEGVESETKSYDIGIYEFTLNAAAGGIGCQDGLSYTFGGRGATVKALLKFTQRTEVQFIIGKKPRSVCYTYNLGGYPNGGSSGSDWFNQDNSGGGGGMTAIMIDGEYILIAGGGAGGAGIFNGSHGGGFGYTLHVTKYGQIEDYSVLYVQNIMQGEDGGYALETPGSGGGGGWFGGKGGIGSEKTNPIVCGHGGVSGYLNISQHFITNPIARDGRFTNNDGDGSARVLQIIMKDTVPENNRKPRKILVASSMYMSFAATNMF